MKEQNREMEIRERALEEARAEDRCADVLDGAQEQVYEALQDVASTGRFPDLEEQLRAAGAMFSAAIYHCRERAAARTEGAVR